MIIASILYVILFADSGYAMIITVNDDGDAGELVKAYQAQAERMAELEKSNKPIEVEEKRKLAELEEKIGTHPTLAELTRRQVDFVEMMRKVKQAIDQELQIDL